MYSENIEEATEECPFAYINFCMDVVVSVRTVHCYANNKPWITSNIKGLLNKKRVFKDGDQQELKRVQKDLKIQLREAKEGYRRKQCRLQKLNINSMKEVWDRMKTITGCSSKQRTTLDVGVVRVSQLNYFFNRFNHSKPLTSQRSAASSHPSAIFIPTSSDSVTDPVTKNNVPPPIITAEQVSDALSRLRPNKAAGTDGVSPCLLKAWAMELGNL